MRIRGIIDTITDARSCIRKKEGLINFKDIVAAVNVFFWRMLGF